MFLLTAAAFMFHPAMAATNTTNASNSTNATTANDNAAYSKIQYAPSDKAIRGDFIVVFNQSRVDDLRTIVNALGVNGINVTAFFNKVKMLKLSVLNISDSFGYDVIKAKLLPWLRSELVELVEEVGICERVTSAIE